MRERRTLQGGAGGAERLRDSNELEALLARQRAAGRRWAAVCASPAVVFQTKGWLEGRKATCHPAFIDRLADGRRALGTAALAARMGDTWG